MMSISEYVADFTVKMKLVPYLNPTKLSKVNKFASVLLVDFVPMFKLAATLKTTIWVTGNVETQIMEKGLENAKAKEKRNLEGSSRSSKKSKFPKSDPNGKRYGGNKEAKWCEKCIMKQFRGSIEGMAYANECAAKKEVCFKCGEEGHVKLNCPKRE